MSQAATVKRISIQNERVRVVAHFREQGSILQGTKEGRCDGFEIELALDSAEPAEQISALIRLAHRMCFTEDTLSRPVPYTTTHLLNGQPLPVGDELN